MILYHINFVKVNIDNFLIVNKPRNTIYKIGLYILIFSKANGRIERKENNTVEFHQSAPANKACPPTRRITCNPMKNFVADFILAIGQLHYKA